MKGTIHCFEETGDVRPPKKGEWFVNTNGDVYLAPMNYTYNRFPIARRLPDARVLTEEGVVAVKELHDALTGKYHTVTAKTGEDCQCDICQKMMKLRAAFPEIFAPKPQERETTAADVLDVARERLESETFGLSDVKARLIEIIHASRKLDSALGSLAERVKGMEGR